MLLIQSQLGAVVSDKMHFKQVVFLFQKRFRICFPFTELVVGRKKLIAIQTNFGVGVKTFKTKLNILFFK